MFGSTVLDLAIGLVLIYLVIALAGSAVAEAVSQFLSMRASELKTALIGMLGDSNGSTTPPTGVGHSLTAMFTGIYGSRIDPKHPFFAQALISSLAKAGGQLQSYLDSKTFSVALMIMLDPAYARKSANEIAELIHKSSLPKSTQELLISYLVTANGDLEKFMTSIETWFNSVMDRVSGWYKRRIANWILVFSLFIVVGANIDTFAIVQALYGDPKLRAQMVELAKNDMEDLGKAAGATSVPVPGAGGDKASANAVTAKQNAPGANAGGAGDKPIPRVLANLKTATPTASDAKAAPPIPAATSNPPPVAEGNHDDKKADEKAAASTGAAPTPPAVPGSADDKGKLDEKKKAEQQAAKGSGATDDIKKYAQTMQAFQAAGIPIGWQTQKPLPGFADWLTKIFGLLITICAVSLGAPFWFDMLSKLVKIRSSGPKIDVPSTKKDLGSGDKSVTVGS